MIHLRYQHSTHGPVPLCDRANWSGLTDIAERNECWECASIAGHRWGECVHCGRRIYLTAHDGWVDPEATGDDDIWRKTCDAATTFEAEHEPKEEP